MSHFRLRRLRDRAASAATLIGEGCKISGLITGKGDFLISGEIEGECDIEGSVTLARNGFWKGTIRASSVIVCGSVEGNIEASGSVEVSETARISGTVTGEAIAVAEGAVVDGNMTTSGTRQPSNFVEKRRPDHSARTGRES